jgi:hypothetical protein
MGLFVVNFVHGQKKLGDAGVKPGRLILLGLMLHLPTIGLVSQLLLRRQ